jgi:hypothetical protein
MSKQQCPVCGGTILSDFFQIGSGEVDCDGCSGRGEDDDGNKCRLCDGDGKIRCSKCHGEGYIADSHFSTVRLGSNQTQKTEKPLDCSSGFAN